MTRLTRTVLAVLAGCGLASQGQAGVFTKLIPAPAPCTNCQTKGSVTPYQTVAPPLANGQPLATITPVAMPGQAPPGKVLNAVPADMEVIDQTGPAVATEAAVTRVRSKHLQFSYDFRDVGPSGVSGVEVYYTRDGSAWQKFPGMMRENPCSVDVEEEGLYGITLVARTGFGGGKDAPQPGDQPQMWVDVDCTKPVLFLNEVTPGAGTRTLTLKWTARDKNFGRRPVSLYYSETNAGPWLPIINTTENTGSYIWQIQPTTPSSFFVRVEAVDLAGNATTADTPSPVLIDLAQPNVTNIRLTTN